MKTLLFVALFGLFANLIYAQPNNVIEICSELQLIKISDNAYVHVSYIDVGNNIKYPCNGLILIDNGNAFLFDTPVNDSTTQILVLYLKDKMKLNLVGFIANDWHRDTMGGLNVINALGIPSYTNEMTREIARTKSLPVPTHGFKDSLSLKLGNKDIRCYYLGAAHTMDNIVVWIPSESILFADCMVKEVKAGDLGFTGDGDVKAYPATLAKVKAKFSSARIVIPGHGAFGGPELIDHTIKLATPK